MDIKMMTDGDTAALLGLALFFGGGLLAIISALIVFGFWPVMMVVGYALGNVGRKLLLQVAEEDTING